MDVVDPGNHVRGLVIHCNGDRCRVCVVGECFLQLVIERGDALPIGFALKVCS